MAPVETERLRLRPVELTDAPRLVELLTPGASRWLISWPPDYATEAMEVRIRKAQAAMLEGRSFFFRCRTEDGTLRAGHCRSNPA